MEKRNKVKTAIFLTVMGSAGLTACNDDDHSSSASNPPPPVTELTDCMWQNSVTSKSHTGEDPLNFAFPDTNVNYWSSEFTVPEGAKVMIDGDYPYSRHFSLVSYTAKGERVNSLLDRAIEPNQGATNPFVEGNNRLGKERAYSAQLQLANLPATPAKNTLYAPKTADNKVAILYRVYVPNKNMNEKGNVSFPRFKVQLANGEVKKGNEVCNLLQVKQGPIDRTTTLPLQATLAAFNQNRYEGFPAQLEPKWYKAFSGLDNFKCTYKFDPVTKQPLEKCEGLTVTPKLNYWATPDNEYVFAATSRRLGKVIELRGKVPNTEKTFNNDQFVQKTDVRYWSICSNEIISTATNYCLYDENIQKVDKDGFYTIVASLAEDRPANAREECGVYFLELSPRGSGYTAEDGKAFGHTDFGLLIMRNLLPDPAFKHAVQNVKAWGDEKTVMGDYLPDIRYTSKAAFEDKGCV
ncbi:hypothetical protein AWW72_11385 [Acinetobacter sp. NRRL B-65365]|uniref:hypothetical protein n=1 Tax=Acinetobacter sp. NRRL B-65365 TaxID=1785092 RepID=UPI0007A05F16|nr:hypothetical protein [Acinetobacter sp. NRRL B-65365]KYQ83996.1 hypothetical protein AWW72_11385 [Acinetobacter sp. NRRL B-65365]